MGYVCREFAKIAGIVRWIVQSEFWKKLLRIDRFPCLLYFVLFPFLISFSWLASVYLKMLQMMLDCRGITFYNRHYKFSLLEKKVFFSFLSFYFQNDNKFTSCSNTRQRLCHFITHAIKNGNKTRTTSFK